MIRPITVISVVLGLATLLVRGEAPGTDAPTATNSAPTAPTVLDAEAEAGWAFSAAVYTYIVPEDDDYAQPTLTADRGRLHLETRYNYENLDTGSAWIGCNLSGGGALAWEFTPMLGGVSGDTDGIAPGYKGSLGWRKLELYSEGEYVIDGHDAAESFFYNWSELTLAPADWCRFGLVTQRTRVYQAEREIQRGLLAGVSFRRVDLAAYVLNPDDDRPTVVVAVGVSF